MIENDIKVFADALRREERSLSLELSRVTLRIRVALKTVVAATDGEERVGPLCDLNEALEELERIVVNDTGYSTASESLENAAFAAAGRAANAELHPINDPAVRQQVIDLTGGRCAYCGVDLTVGLGRNDAFCVEHVVPASHGGPNNIRNYVPACKSCNSGKSDSHVIHFIRANITRMSQARPELKVVGGDA